MNKKKIKLCFSLVLMVGATLWAFVAPWFSANNKFTVGTEFGSYCLAVPVLVYGAVKFLQCDRPRLIFRRLLAGWFSFCFLVAWNQSSRQFFYWKLRFVPPEAWARMETDMQKGTAEVKNPDGTSYMHMIYADSFKWLGTPDDYVGCSYAPKDTETSHPGFVDEMCFGHGRMWGVFEGSSKSLNDSRPGFKSVHIPNTENLYFYIN